MHSVDLAQFSAVFVRYSSDMLVLRCSPCRQSQQDYWLESRFRYDFWSGKLAAHRQNLSGGGAASRQRSWSQVLPVLEEILLSEPLTRCVAYHARLLAERGIETDLTAVAQSVLSSHIEARHRCLHLIVFGEGLDATDSNRLNHLRRGLETYNDALLSFLDPIHCDDVYSFDPIRVRRAQQSRSLDSESKQSAAFSLSLLPQIMRCVIQDRLTYWNPPHQANEKLLSSVLRFLPGIMFDSVGFPLSSASAQVRRESPECSLDAELIAEPQGWSMGLLLAPVRASSRATGTEKPRW
jgi:hypothetical protein